MGMRLDRPLRSMKVYRREIGTFLILFGFGFLLLAGGWVKAYFGGVWEISSPTRAGAAGLDGPSLSLLTNYVQCTGLLASTQTLFPLLGPFAGEASCSLRSFAPIGLTFVAVGGLSMLVGAVAFRKRFSSMGESVSALWWVLALLVPLFGGIIGYLGVRGRNRTSALNMALLAVETFLGSTLLFLLTGFPLVLP